MPAAYKKVNTDDKDINKLQENLSQFFVSIENNPIIDGTLFKEVVLTSGQANLIEHKLSRKPLGWVVIRKRGQSDIWDLQDSNSLPSRTLDLRCSSTVTVDLWIF